MQEQLIDGILAKYAQPQDFKIHEQLESCPNNFKVWDLNYYQDEGLHNLEAFAEGTFTIGNILKVERKYLASGSTPEEIKKGAGDNFTYYTKVTNIELDNRPPIG